jgi:prepilin-type N-terminal cleavage/methylation domain-containing protein
MHTLARFPAREAHLSRQVGNRAFTLIELLTVMAIIAILAAISFGVVGAVRKRAAIGQAKAQLSSLALALEAYKLQYGDYPQATTGTSWPGGLSSNETKFLQALIGKRGPTGANITGKNFIEISKFSLSSTGGDPLTTDTITLIDPWGGDYKYFYYTKGTTSVINKRGYVLFSEGPDGDSADPDESGATGGDAKMSDLKNLDNIYAN